MIKWHIRHLHENRVRRRSKDRSRIRPRSNMRNWMGIKMKLCLKLSIEMGTRGIMVKDVDTSRI